MREAALLILVLLAAVTIRCYRITDESMWGDETASVKYQDSPNLADFLAKERTGDPAMVPFYFCLEYGCLKWAPNPVLSCRLMSIFFGTMAILVLYAIGRRVYGPTAALIGAACAAMAIQQVYYSQEIRMYALYALLGAISVYAFHRILRDEGIGWWPVYAAANALLVWTHLYGVLLVLIEGVFLAVAKRKEPRITVSWLTIHGPLLFSVGIWVATIDPVQLNANLSWIPALVSDGTFQFIKDSMLAMADQEKAVGVLSADTPPVAAQSVAAGLGFGLAVKIAIGVLCTTLVGWIAVLGLRGRGNTERDFFRTDTLLILAWALAPTVILVVLTFVWRPTFLPRYVLPSFLAVYVLVGGAIASFRSAWIKVALACLVIGLYAYDNYAFGVPHRPNMRDAIGVVNAASLRDGEKVFVRPIGYDVPAGMYADFPADRIAGFDDCTLLADAVADAVGAGHRCWLVVGDAMGMPPDVAPLLESRGLAFEVREFPGAFPVFVYRVDSR